MLQRLSPIVITLPDRYQNEAEAIGALIAAGAEIIHLRKPGSGDGEVASLLATLAEVGIMDHITLHYNLALAEEFGTGGVHVREEELKRADNHFRKSASCHSWDEVKKLTGKADYVFLSPLFDSISKAGYHAAFDEEELHVRLKEKGRPAVVGLGGITSGNISAVRGYGFDGAACIGGVWAIGEGGIDIPKSVANYLEITKKWNEAK